MNIIEGLNIQENLTLVTGYITETQLQNKTTLHIPLHNHVKVQLKIPQIQK